MNATPPRVRIVDFAGNHGGGLRFAVELLRALHERQDGRISFELVSHGEALDRYAAALSSANLPVPLRDMVPPSHRRPWLVRLRGLPRIGGLLSRLARISNQTYSLPEEITSGCDALLLPWIHGHRAPTTNNARVIASLHDLIVFQIPGVMPRMLVEIERRNLRRWLDSKAQVVVSSHATRDALGELFSVPAPRVQVVRVAIEHLARLEPGELDPTWDFVHRPFLLCPANSARHKNHEVLFRALRIWGARVPVVLTGKGIDLRDRWSRRNATLRAELAACGLVPGRDVHLLGYVDDRRYFALLERAWALVMPSLQEGGGSFPTMEALVRGVPVLCSDIPVLREQMTQMNADVLWFDPRRPQTLADQFAVLEGEALERRQRAIAQVARLRRRTWFEVARDYETIFARVSPALAAVLPGGGSAEETTSPVA